MRTLLGNRDEPRRENRRQHVDVYLDVDGVVVPAFDPAVGVDSVRSGWRDWRGQSLTHGRAEPIAGLTAYSPCMARRIKTLAELDHVTVHWCTTWGKRANDLGKRLGIPRLDVIDADRRFMLGEQVTASSWWKRDAVQAHHEQRKDHAVVWIDDDLGFDEKARLWMRGLGRSALSISPDTSVGLTSREVRRIEQFVMH